VKKTKTGRSSTDSSVLEELAPSCTELPAVIIEHRALAKLQGTYIEALPREVDPRPGASTRASTRPWRPRGALVEGPEPAEHPDPHRDRPRIRECFVARRACS
jgi:hypothetical protein